MNNQTESRIPSGYQIGRQHAAERVLQQVRWSSGRASLGDEDFPTTRQIACVMHALADLTHQEHMLSTAVADLYANGADRHSQAHGLGRYFHGLGNYMDSKAYEEETRR